MYDALCSSVGAVRVGNGCAGDGRDALDVEGFWLSSVVGGGADGRGPTCTAGGGKGMLGEYRSGR
jgi:hypothetical protein